MSQTRLKVCPLARPAGFHQVAVASSATATNAPPIPCARVPTSSYICAAAGDAHTITTAAASRPRTANVMLTTVSERRERIGGSGNWVIGKLGDRVIG